MADSKEPVEERTVPTAPQPPIALPASSAGELRVVEEQIPTSHDAVIQAGKEAHALADGTLEDVARRNEHGRREQLRDVVHQCSVFAIKSVLVLALLAGLIVAWHWLTPALWHFLTAVQLDKLEAVGTSAVLSGLVATYGKKIVAKL